jgi:hypothetical protein
VSQAVANTVITQPNAAYLAATNKIDFSALATGAAVSAVGDSLNQVFFDQAMTKGSVPGGGWSTWAAPPSAESTAPSVLYSYTYTALNMQLGQPVREFGFELEPDAFAIATETVTFRVWMGSTVVQTITLPVDGSAGSRLFAVLSDTAFSRVEISAPTGNGFAIAQLRYALPTSVTKPAVAPSSPKRYSTTTFVARLSPAAAGAGGSANLALYHRETKRVTRIVNGKRKRVRVAYWRLRKTVPMSVASWGRLLVRTKLPYRGTWLARTTYSGTMGYVAATSPSATFRVR